MSDYVDKFNMYGTEVKVMGQPNPFEGRNFGFIGDSMTYGATLDSPTTQRWSSILCHAVKANEYNVAQGGAQFISSTVMSFTEQVDYLYQRQPNIDYVFFWGGYNDVYRGESNDNLSIYATALVEKISKRFPYCTIVWMGLNLPFGGFQQRVFWRYRNAYNNFQLFQMDFPNINCVYGSLLVAALSGYYSNDMIHPNQSGHALMARYLNTAIRGISMDYTYNGQGEFYATFTGNAPCEINGRYLDVRMENITPTVALSANKRYAFFTFNYVAKPFYPVLVGTGFTTSALKNDVVKNPVYLVWETDNHFYIYTTSEIPANQNIYFPPCHLDWLFY